MDPNFGNFGYFPPPDDQKLEPLEQPDDISRLTASELQPSALWGEPALAAGGLGRARDPSTGAPSLYLDSFVPSTGASSLNAYSPAAMSPSLFTQRTRPIIAPRPQRSRDGHERKRSRLNTESTPFDSVDYWIQFDQEQQQQQLLIQQQQLQQLQLQQEQMQQAQLQQQQMQRQQQLLAKQQRHHSKHRHEHQKRKEQSDQGHAAGSATSATASASQRKAQKSKGSTPTTSETRSTGLPKLEEGLDDTALENALSEEGAEGLSYSSINLADQLSGIDSMPPADVPQREGLYSTPLSWERPQMGLRLDSLMGLQTPALSEAEQRRLIAIAMNSSSSMGGLGNNVNTGFNTFPPNMFGPGLGTASLSQISNGDFMASMAAPPMSSTSKAPTQASAQSERSGDPDKGKEKLKSADRAAHNDIERKYRTNLKDKIAELRDAVPTLRTIPENSVDDGEGEGSAQASRTPKVSKGTVLTKATDYIHHLEKKNKAIMQQHQELSRRLQAFEQLLNASARPTFQMPNYSRTLFDPRAFC